MTNEFVDRRYFVRSSACCGLTALLAQAGPTSVPNTGAPREPPSLTRPPVPNSGAARLFAAHGAWLNFEFIVSWPGMNALQQVVTSLVARGINDLTLAISSSGGDVSAALSTYNFLTSAGIKLTTYNIGNIYSAAVLLFLAGERRVCETSAQFIIHPPSLNGAAGPATASDLELRTDALGHDTDRMRDVIVSRTHISRERVGEMLRKTTFISPQAAIENGLATEVTHLARGSDTLLVNIAPPIQSLAAPRPSATP